MRALPLVVACLAAPAQPARNTADILNRTRARLLETLDHLPKYPCMQSLDRTVYLRPVAWPSCGSVAVAGLASQLELSSRDRLNLDVAVTSTGREIYSWSGAAQFQAENPARIIGPGAIGTG